MTAGAARAEQRTYPVLDSYWPLARGLVGDLLGICVLDRHLKSRGQAGGMEVELVRKWLHSLGWIRETRRLPAAVGRGQNRWWVGIPLAQSDGTLVGAVCISRKCAAAPAQPARFAADLALRIKPLLDCIYRELATAAAPQATLQSLTERSAELEWLFKLTASLKGTVNDTHMMEGLVAAATRRLRSALGVLYIPDKRLAVKHGNGAASLNLCDAWEQTRDHLMGWMQRQNRPLVVNSVGRSRKNIMRCKVLAVPVVRDTGRVIGALAFYNPPQAADYSARQVFLARLIGRQSASLVDAQFDLMTGLYTRDGLDQVYSRLGDSVESYESDESSVIYLDIDHMHVANEMHGFELGNELIVRVAQILTVPILPENALAARVAGDRFAVILPNKDGTLAAGIAEAIRAAAAKITIGPPENRFEVSISGGIAALVPVPDALARTIAAAELACKTAKSHGRNRIETYAFDDGSMLRLHGDAMAVGQLRAALKEDRLLLYAQRITPLQNPNLPGGYELLLRLRELGGEVVAPGPLIDSAKRYQLLPSIDQWVVRRALRMLEPYRAMLATRGLSMSINVSGQSFGDETLVEQFSQLLKDARLPRDCITVELTEQAAITDMAGARQMVDRMGAQGCRFALDDFGTGANSLTYLKTLQVNRVKIDGSFVRDVLVDRNSQATVRGIVELAKGMGIETVAEYVENTAIADAVRQMGVDYAQGYAFGKPEPLGDVLEALALDESRRLHRLFLET